MNSDVIVFEEAVASLGDGSRDLVAELHARSTSAGFAALVSAVGQKPGNYKIEYKKPKAAGSLYIARIDGGKLSLRCKLFHLAEYCELLDALSDAALNGFLGSGGCKRDGGCKGPVEFCVGGKAHSLCRHAMRFAALSAADVQAVWNLLEQEDRRRN